MIIKRRTTKIYQTDTRQEAEKVIERENGLKLGNHKLDTKIFEVGNKYLVEVNEDVDNIIKPLSSEYSDILGCKIEAFEVEPMEDLK